MLEKKRSFPSAKNFLVNESIEDLFICGKCQRHFVDLNIFLDHRSVCRSGKSNSEMNFQVSHLDSIVDENPSNEFDLLFSMPVGQMILNSEVSSSPSSFSNMKPTNENQLNPFECPVCDENFSDDHNLTTHLLEHSFCTDGQEEKVNSSIEQRDSFQCQICTVNFASNGRLNFHKKTSKIVEQQKEIRLSTV